MVNVRHRFILLTCKTDNNLCCQTKNLHCDDEKMHNMRHL